ncbi:DUF3376 domain-containing protein [Streptomyces sp. 8N616]|uniref:DUF3376 domain-containing protein n=1 Tax=Streptomyces sp. 8N616 TaxID=3457414 RepID=UPI003FCFBACB
MSVATDEEIRLALVMNGGVSLAVWMGGVTHEIDLLRRASDPQVGPKMVRPEDRPVFERWREACGGSPDGPKRRVVVDVVAGTSAGGLNGTLLATAIARGTALDALPDKPAKRRNSHGPKLKNVWRNDASLEFGKLLPRPGDRPRPSVLSGDHFASAIRSFIESIPEAEGGEGAEGAAGAEDRPVSLFVTATSTGPEAQTYVDAFGNPLSCADHRRIFRFERRVDKYRYHAVVAGLEPRQDAFEKLSRNDFGVKNGFPEALVSAARASASYPVAFAPVDETGLQELRVDEPRVGGPAWLIDGGVLDNAPFAPVLQAIASRELSGPVRRLLVYVVPSSGSQASAAATAAATAPAGPLPMPRWTEIVSSAIQYPREADFRADVEGIQSLLGQADGLWGDGTEFFGSLLEEPGDARYAAAADERRERATAAARTLLPTYCRARTVGDMFEARRLVATSSLAPTRAAGRDLPAAPLWVPDRATDFDRDLAADPWRWGVTGASQTVRLLLRDLRRRLDSADETMPAGARTALCDGLAGLSREWIPRIDAMSEEIVRAQRTELAKADATDDAAALIAMNRSLESLRAPETLAWLVRQAVDVYKSAAQTRFGAHDILRYALSVEVISRAFNARSPVCPVPPFEFLRLGPDVESPILGPSLNTRIKIKAESKLYGTQLHHFGAFGDPSWRDWDWLIGRLDAVAHLGKVLGKGPDWVEETQRAVLKSEGVEVDQLTAQVDRMLNISWTKLLGELKRQPRGRGRKLVRNVVNSLADGLEHMDHPPKLSGPARFIARRRTARRIWLWRKGF